MTFDHLRPILDSPRDTHVLFLVAEIMARAQIPADIIGAVRVGRMTAFRKRTGGVRGIVAGDALRRLIARTIAQQMGEAVKAATAPFQYALSTRAGCECVAMSDLNPNATITSIDGVSAYDSISRRAMLEEKVPGGREVLPFVLMFYGSPSSYFWEDEGGVTHSIAQGEGGEQGDPLVPLLFALGQHPALLATQRRLDPSEKVFAFLDDIYTKTEPSRVGVAYTTVQEELLNHCHIRVHTGKTQVWNQGGIRPEACDLLDRIAQQADPDAHVWKGAGLPEVDQGFRVLGTPLGHPAYVEAQLETLAVEHQDFLDRIPLLPDLQCAWSLLLHCASARATYYIRAVRPECSFRFARRHDEGLWRCLCRLLDIPHDSVPQRIKDSCTLSQVLGGLGLRSATRTRETAFWGSWADAVHMIHERHPDVAAHMVAGLLHPGDAPNLGAAARAADNLRGVGGFEPPAWHDLRLGASSSDANRRFRIPWAGMAA